MNSQKYNHFSSVCRSNRNTTGAANPQSRKPRYMEKETHSTSTTYNQYNIRTSKVARSLVIRMIICLVRSEDSQSPKAGVNVLGHKLKMTVDTGTTLNVIDRSTFAKLKGSVKLRKTNTRAYAYNTTEPVEFMRIFEALIETKRNYLPCTFYVTKTNNSCCLMSNKTAQELGLISYI